MKNGMYDVYSSDPKDASSCFGYQILLSSGMDAVKSPDHKDDSSLLVTQFG